MPTKDDLRLLQALPLDVKVAKTELRIREWVDRFGVDGVYVSFSGGEDSTVLLHIVREMYGNDIPAVFVDTGLEYPEIRQFAKSFENVEIRRPKMRFDEVVKQYGYPLISKDVSNCIRGARDGWDSRCKKLTVVTGSKFDKIKWYPLIFLPYKISEECCDKTKKAPCKEYEAATGRAMITGEMADESLMREAQWLDHGCNGFNLGRPKSAPMSFWTTQDILQYIKAENLRICSVYGDIVAVDDCKNHYDAPLIDGLKLKTTGCQRTGCIFCAFGAHCRGDTRFIDLKQTHPKQYAYCIGGGEFVNGLWQPSRDGLGMGYVFDQLNGIYGPEFIRYK